MHELFDGDMYAAYFEASGTMLGNLLGTPATGMTVSWGEGYLGRVRDGNLVEHWGVADQLGTLRQLGLVP